MGFRNTAVSITLSFSETLLYLYIIHLNHIFGDFHWLLTSSLVPVHISSRTIIHWSRDFCVYSLAWKLAFYQIICLRNILWKNIKFKYCSYIPCFSIVWICSIFQWLIFQLKLEIYQEVFVVFLSLRLKCN